MVLTRAVFLFLLLTLAGGVGAEPAWVVAERADAQADAGEYGEAIRLYRSIVIEQPNSVVANLGLARCYEATADLDLALEHLQIAAAVAPNDATVGAIRLRMAQIYRTKQLFKQYEESLLTVAGSDPALQDTEFANLPQRLRTTYAQNGVDRMLVLYRSDYTYATPAHAELAVFYVQSGRYEAALEEALISVVATASTIIEELIRRDPLYEFDSLAETINAAEEDEALVTYLDRSTLYRDLYYLAAATYGAATIPLSRAVSVWSILAELPGGIWTRRAVAQTRSPTLEPVIFVDLE